MSERVPSRLLVAPDSRAAEAALVAELSRAADASPLSRTTVIVPSHSLRIAVLTKLAESRSAWLGLEVVTLRGLARSILERSGVEHHSGDALLPLLVERLAREERALSRPLETLIDGFAGARAAVSDLLDAGFSAEHLGPALERLDAERPLHGHDALDRAAALCRVASSSREALLEVGLAPDADLYLSAADCLAADPDRALSADRVFIHGFADATGVATDLLTTIARVHTTTIVLLDPRGFDGTSAVDWRFGRRLRERFAGIAKSVEVESEFPPARLTLFLAADPVREARSAIGRLAALATSSVPIENFALVARDLTPSRSHLAREIDRQALPASGSDGPSAPLRRRARGLLELIERRGESPLGTAFAVAGEFLARDAHAGSWELRLAALALGARRLGEFARRPTPAAGRNGEDRLPETSSFSFSSSTSTSTSTLPMHDRFGVRGENATALVARRRPLDPGALRQGRRQAVRLLERLDGLARRQPLHEAHRRLQELVALVVDAPADRAELLAPLAAWAAAGVAEVEITAIELALLLRGAWAEVGARPLGGAPPEPTASTAGVSFDGLGSGGAAILNVTEARARTFSHLVLTGLTRDRFPRAVRADPFLPDALRLALRDLLPDLPVKSEGHDEERFLFAQLLGAAPALDLFVALADDEGKAQSPSSFLDELRRARRFGEADGIPAPPPAMMAALDLAAEAALEGSAPELAAAFALAFREGEARFGPAGTPRKTAAAADADSDVDSGADAWATSHLDVLAELSAGPQDPRFHRAGPYFGFAGNRDANEATAERAAAAGPDPRPRTPSVTTLQALADCGWQTFLTKILRLGTLPTGEEELPELPRRLVGTVVHGVLEAMSPPDLVDVATLADAERRIAERPEGVAVVWPAPERLREQIIRTVHSVLMEEGFDPALFAAPIEAAAAEALEQARAIDWPDGSRALFGLEIAGESDLFLPVGPRTIGFRADRVELEDGNLLLSDYKTGKGVVSGAKKAETRASHLRRDLAAGKWLQLPVYAAARSARPAIGRLLFLHPDLGDEIRDVRHVAATPGSPDNVVETELWDTLFRAWEGGTFLPRLLDGTLQKTFEGCEYCEVRVACLQGDSSARLRFESWMKAMDSPEDESRPAAVAAALFRLRTKSGG
ncbi:MAG: PD-(D/E)XK nuclease family protein [Thermoanaerobaculia bacterium]